MKIDNKDFWENQEVIATQRLKNASDFELYMFEEAQKRYGHCGPITTIKIFGCGTGREIEAVASFFKPLRIVASDISENMIAKCKENLKRWNLAFFTETVVCNAVDYKAEASVFELVTILNSMLTYVPKRADRISIFKNSHALLKSNGTLIGTVHNQEGTPLKTLYFKLRRLFSFLLGERVGNRNTGFKGFKVPGYYYHRSTLQKDLEACGFSAISILSLEEYSASKGAVYNRKTGYNNLIFMATKA